MPEGTIEGTLTIIADSEADAEQVREALLEISHQVEDMEVSVEDCTLIAVLDGHTHDLESVTDALEDLEDRFDLVKTRGRLVLTDEYGMVEEWEF